MTINKEKQQKAVLWQPKKGDCYYYIDDCGKAAFDKWHNDYIDRFRYAQNNSYRTIKEAGEYLNNLNIKGELRLLAEELNNGEVIDWDDWMQPKYYIGYQSFPDNILSIFYVLTIKCQSVIYCLNENFLDEAKKRIGEDRLIKMIKSGV
ncbi:MAG: hypothetical protein LUH11_03220 [Candidatus Gastranaerophilales bacterium]|nr:hypothetical protein [Candidatus Gastranaerophilales bacterium]